MADDHPPEHPTTPEAETALETSRLRLVPIGPSNAADLLLVHSDNSVAPWYDGRPPTRAEVDEQATRMDESWRLHGVHKWMAYDRETGEVIGRGGLSRAPIDDDWAQLYRFLPDEAWVRQPHESERPYPAHAQWLEVGWALRSEHWGRGYATEIGEAALTYAFEVLGVRAVVSCTVRHNIRSQAVMERLGMHYAGEIHSRGVVADEPGMRDDAPFAAYVTLGAHKR